MILLFNGKQRWDLNFLNVSLGTAGCILAAMLHTFFLSTPRMSCCSYDFFFPSYERREWSNNGQLDSRYLSLYSYRKGGKYVWGRMEHLREIRPRCQGGDGLQPTGARGWKLLELVAEQSASTRPFFSIPSITTRFSLTATCRLPVYRMSSLLA